DLVASVLDRLTGRARDRLDLPPAHEVGVLRLVRRLAATRAQRRLVQDQRLGELPVPRRPPLTVVVAAAQEHGRTRTPRPRGLQRNDQVPSVSEVRREKGAGISGSTSSAACDAVIRLSSCVSPSRFRSFVNCSTVTAGTTTAPSSSTSASTVRPSANSILRTAAVM